MGGPADGMRIDVDPKLNYLDIATTASSCYVTTELEAIKPEARLIFRYRKELIACDTQDYFVFVPEGWDCHDIVEAFIANYRK